MRVLASRGLRISIGGAVLFLAGLAALAFLPTGVAVAGILAGGLIVWGGFLWTIFSYYARPSETRTPGEDSDEPPAGAAKGEGAGPSS